MTDAEGRYEFRDLPGGRFNLSANKAGYRDRPVRTNASVRIRQSDRSDRRSADGQSRHLDAARKRDLRTAGRRVRRPCCRRGRQRDAIGVVRRTTAPSADGTHGDDQRSRAVPHLRIVAWRLLRERDLPRRRHDGDGDGDGAMGGGGAGRAGRSDPTRTPATHRPISPARRTAPRRRRSR